MTTSKTTDLSVKTQQQTVEILTERLNTIHSNINSLLDYLHGTKASIGILALIQSLDKSDQMRFNSGDIEVLLNNSEKDISKTIDMLIDISNICDVRK